MESSRLVRPYPSSWNHVELWRRPTNIVETMRPWGIPYCSWSLACEEDLFSALGSRLRKSYSNPPSTKLSWVTTICAPLRNSLSLFSSPRAIDHGRGQIVLLDLVGDQSVVFLIHSASAHMLGLHTNCNCLCGGERLIKVSAPSCVDDGVFLSSLPS